MTQLKERKHQMLHTIHGILNIPSPTNYIEMLTKSIYSKKGVNYQKLKNVSLVKTSSETKNLTSPPRQSTTKTSTIQIQTPSCPSLSTTSSTSSNPLTYFSCVAVALLMLLINISCVESTKDHLNPTNLEGKVGSYVVFNCRIDFPYDYRIPYVVHWSKDVSKMPL